MTEQFEIIPISPWKRAFDVIVSPCIILILSPIILLFTLAIALERVFFPSTRGPFFYREIRISQGKPFMFYKIRTFKLSALAKAKQNGTIHTKELERDFRNLTPVGLVLRQVYLDEFPQFFLVLRGHMSLVGPRPNNSKEYEEGVVNGIKAKTILRAGLTGPFQLHNEHESVHNQEIVDMQYAEFCRTHSGLRIVLYDLLILLKTIATMVKAEGF